MLKIRLQRIGRKSEPSFRLVLTDSMNSTKSGRFKEILGSYDPRKMADALKTDRIKHWISMGAHPTGTVHNLLVRHGLVRGKKSHVGADYVAKAPAEEAPASEVVQEAPVAEEPAAPAEAPIEDKNDTIEAAPAEEPKAE